MTARGPIDAILDIQEATGGKASRLESGPLRLEISGAWLEGGAAPEPPWLESVLEESSYLGIRWEAPPGAGGLAWIQERAERFQLHLDLQMPLCGAKTAFSEALLERTVRLTFDTPLASLLDDPESLRAAAELTGRIPGHGVLRVRVEGRAEGELEGVPARVSEAAPGLDLHFTPGDTGAAATLAALREPLLEEARRAALNISFSGLGGGTFGKPHDHLLVWNVQRAFLRHLFRLHPGLCPFPFVMLRLDEEGQARVCPQPQGPRVSAPGAEGPWNAEETRALRAAFHEGSPPEPCLRCTLWPRLLRSLAGSGESGAHD